jgi:hypothetical protein
MSRGKKEWDRKDYRPKPERMCMTCYGKDKDCKVCKGKSWRWVHDE